MGTRSGSVDPGILTHLMRQGQVDGQNIDKILNQNSGLLGVSGFSSDMRDILTAIEQGHESAKLAFEICVHRLRAAIGGMAFAISRQTSAPLSIRMLLLWTLACVFW